MHRAAVARCAQCTATCVPSQPRCQLVVGPLGPPPHCMQEVARHLHAPASGRSPRPSRCHPANPTPCTQLPGSNHAPSPSLSDPRICWARQHASIMFPTCPASRAWELLHASSVEAASAGGGPGTGDMYVSCPGCSSADGAAAELGRSNSAKNSMSPSSRAPLPQVGVEVREPAGAGLPGRRASLPPRQARPRAPARPLPGLVAANVSGTTAAARSLGPTQRFNGSVLARKGFVPAVVDFGLGGVANKKRVDGGGWCTP